MAKGNAGVQSKLESFEKNQDAFLLAPEDIIVLEDSRGRHFPPNEEEYNKVKDDIRTKGQLQPVVVRKSASRFILAAGYTRHQIVKELRAEGMTELKLKCQFMELNEAAAFTANISENFARNRVSIVDTAWNCARLKNKFGYTTAQIAKAYGKSDIWVAQCLKLATLSDEHQLQIHQGAMSFSAGIALADLDETQRAAVLEEVKRNRELEAVQQKENDEYEEAKAAAEAQTEPPIANPTGALMSGAVEVDNAFGNPNAPKPRKATGKPNKRKGGRGKNGPTPAEISKAAGKLGVEGGGVFLCKATEVRDLLEDLKELSPICAVLLNFVYGKNTEKDVKKAIQLFQDRANKNLEKIS